MGRRGQGIMTFGTKGAGDYDFFSTGKEMKVNWEQIFLYTVK